MSNFSQYLIKLPALCTKTTIFSVTLASNSCMALSSDLILIGGMCTAAITDGVKMSNITLRYICKYRLTTHYFSSCVFRNSPKKWKDDLPVAPKQIREKLVPVHDQTDKFIGVYSKKDAEKMAKTLDLKLVCVQNSINSREFYFKFISGLELHKQRMKEREEKKDKDIVKDEKLLTVGDKITEHDLNTRIKAIKKWLGKKHNVQVVIEISDEAKSKVDSILKFLTDGLVGIGNVVVLKKKSSRVLLSVSPLLKEETLDIGAIQIKGSLQTDRWTCTPSFTSHLSNLPVDSASLPSDETIPSSAPRPNNFLAKLVVGACEIAFHNDYTGKMIQELTFSSITEGFIILEDFSKDWWWNLKTRVPHASPHRPNKRPDREDPTRRKMMSFKSHFLPTLKCHFDALKMPTVCFLILNPQTKPRRLPPSQGLSQSQSSIMNFGYKSRWYTFDNKEKLLILLQPGDLIEFQRGMYQHWAVYVGGSRSCKLKSLDGWYFTSDEDSPKVVHAGSPAHLNSRNVIFGSMSLDKRRYGMGAVNVEFLYDVWKRSKVRINNEMDEWYRPFDSSEILIRGEIRIKNQTGYNFITNNCEHFAVWCRTGVSNSEQSGEALLIGLAFIANFVLLGMISCPRPGRPTPALKSEQKDDAFSYEKSQNLNLNLQAVNGAYMTVKTGYVRVDSRRYVYKNPTTLPEMQIFLDANNNSFRNNTNVMAMCAIENCARTVGNTRKKNYNPRNYPVVRIIAVLVQKRTVPLYCHLISVVSNKTRSVCAVKAVLSMHKEGWSFEYSSYFIDCVLPKGFHGENQLLFVYVNEGKGFSSENYQLNVHQLKVSEKLKKPTFAVCVKPMHYEYDRAVWLVEFLEFHRILARLPKKMSPKDVLLTKKKKQKKKNTKKNYTKKRNNVVPKRSGISGISGISDDGKLQ
uniref:LRAT domain-containing protein n=1 Tax=Strigamia maritima TaxID=126957 RepID=T1JIE2_STRMM